MTSFCDELDWRSMSGFSRVSTILGRRASSPSLPLGSSPSLLRRFQLSLSCLMLSSVALLLAQSWWICLKSSVFCPSSAQSPCKLLLFWGPGPVSSDICLVGVPSYRTTGYVPAFQLPGREGTLLLLLTAVFRRFASVGRTSCTAPKMNWSCHGVYLQMLSHINFPPSVSHRVHNPWLPISIALTYRTALLLFPSYLLLYQVPPVTGTGTSPPGAPLLP